MRKELALVIMLAVSSAQCEGTSGSSGNNNNNNGGGGSSGWEKLTGPAMGADFQRFRAIDSSRFWMAVSNGAAGAYYSEDGGSTWTLRKPGFFAYGLGLLDQGTRVWVSGLGTPTVWSSSDSGTTFQPITTTPSDWLNHISFFTPQRGFMTSETGDRIHLTTDGGATWTTTQIKDSALLGAGEVAVLGSHVYIASGADFRPDGGTIVHSADAGQTWETVRFVDRANNYEGGRLLGISVVSASEIWVAGGGRQIYHTTDGMKTWTQIASVSDEFGWFGGIAAQGSHIAAVGKTSGGVGVYESHDGGKTWATGFASDCGQVCEPTGAAFVAPGVAYAWGLGGVWLRYKK